MVVIVDLVLAKSDDAHAPFPFTCAVISDYVRHGGLPALILATADNSEINIVYAYISWYLPCSVCIVSLRLQEPQYYLSMCTVTG
jgi:hypothetical protein